jgi:hypothetical protein
MSDNNNPQPLTHMTDSVTPQPTAKVHLTDAQVSITDIYNATLKAMRNIEEAKAAAPSAGISEADLKKLIALTWKEAISFANMHVEDEICKEITVYAHVDERVHDGLDISIRGEVETEVNLGDHLDIEIPERYDGVAQTHDEILQLFRKQQKKEQAASVTAEPVETSIDLSKNNA